MSVHANAEPKEGIANGNVTLTFSLSMKKFLIQNDSSSADLKFKFQEGKPYATLKPTEQLSLYFDSSTVYLQGSGVAYRVWGFG